jgi:3-hydroxyacyl-[acyl-carrier-protein] dehydratase
MKLSHEDVLNFLPHREPFLFVDTVSSIGPLEGIEKTSIVNFKHAIGLKGTAHFHTRNDHPIFAGHFPDYSILPGVIQVEMMAQASSFGLFAVHTDPFTVKLDVALLCISDAKFRKPVLPDMDLVIKAECLKVRGPMVTSRCELYHNDQLMSEATVMASI